MTVSSNEHRPSASHSGPVYAWLPPTLSKANSEGGAPLTLPRLQVTLKLEESQLPDMDQLAQYHVRCQEEDKYLLLNTLLKLQLVRGKTIIFVNDINKSYK